MKGEMEERVGPLLLRRARLRLSTDSPFDPRLCLLLLLLLFGRRRLPNIFATVIPRVENPPLPQAQSRRELIKPGLTLGLNPPVPRNRKLGWLARPRATSSERCRPLSLRSLLPAHLYTPASMMVSDDDFRRIVAFFLRERNRYSSAVQSRRPYEFHLA